MRFCSIDVWAEARTLHAEACTGQSEEQLAEVAQLVEQLIRNQQVIGSSPIFGSKFPRKKEKLWPRSFRALRECLRRHMPM